LPDAGRKAAVQFARSCLKQKYSLRNFLLLAATIALGDRIRMPDSGHGCVSLVARALQEAGIRFDRKPTDMTPVDLAKRFGVTRDSSSAAGLSGVVQREMRESLTNRA
jgi:hypothetical protein